ISEVCFRASSNASRCGRRNIEGLTVIILLRSLAFNALFYLNTLLFLIAALPTFFMPYRAIVEVAKSWGRVNLVLLRVVAGIKCEIRGLEKLPPGPLIVASKHQSAWETFALLPLLDNPVFILKRELQWIPVFGWLTIKGRMVPVDRAQFRPVLAAPLASPLPRNRCRRNSRPDCTGSRQGCLLRPPAE